MINVSNDLRMSILLNSIFLCLLNLSKETTMFKDFYKKYEDTG